MHSRKIRRNVDKLFTDIFQKLGGRRCIFRFVRFMSLTMTACVKCSFHLMHLCHRFILILASPLSLSHSLTHTPTLLVLSIHEYRALYSDFWLKYLQFSIASTGLKRNEHLFCYQIQCFIWKCHCLPYNKKCICNSLFYRLWPNANLKVFLVNCTTHTQLITYAVNYLSWPKRNEWFIFFYIS